MREPFTWPTEEGMRVPKREASILSIHKTRGKSHRKHRSIHWHPIVLRNKNLFQPSRDLSKPTDISTYIPSRQTSFVAKVKILVIHDRRYARIMVKRKVMEFLRLEDGERIHVSLARRRRRE